MSAADVCRCVARHAPAVYVPNRHHIVPKSWGGATVATNLVTVCPNTHTAVHKLIDAYVTSAGKPNLHGYSTFVASLAERAWAGRPSDSPPITSLVAS